MKALIIMFVSFAVFLGSNTSAFATDNSGYDRTEADAKRDKTSKPKQILEFWA